MLANFFGSWILKACIEVQEKRKRVVFLLVTSSSKREIRQVHVVVVQRRHRNVQEGVIHVLSCCFVNLLLLLFCCVLVAVSVRILMCEEPGDKLESDRHWQLPLILGKIVVSLKFVSPLHTGFHLAMMAQSKTFYSAYVKVKCLEKYDKVNSQKCWTAAVSCETSVNRSFRLGNGASGFLHALLPWHLLEVPNDHQTGY